MITVPPPASAAEALGMLRSALGYLAAADPTAMAAETQAQCLRALEQAHSMYTAARTSVLAAFTSGQGYSADADYSPRAWLVNRTRPAGAEDTRSQAQRFHDGLQEAMRRLVTAGLLPERAGQPVKAWVHISLADLMMLEGSSALLEEWTARVRARWAGHRAEASAGGSDGGAWLDGDAAAAVACDAAMAPFVTGEVNPAALEDLVRLCVQLDRLHRRAGDGTGQDGTGQDTARAWEALERAIIGKAVDLLSGPGGLASFLRRRQLGARLGGQSLPLDIGYSETIPAGIRNAVTLRDKHCQWAGRCNQPASACEVHHVRHKKDGGKTSTRDCVLLCWFHHQVVIHRWGWTLVLNPDGTTTAWNPDKTKVLHSHGPPARPG